MKKLLLTLLLGFVSVAAQAGLVVEIHPTQITLDNPFQLIITQSNAQNSNNIPNLAPLKANFEVIGTQRQMSYSNINGQGQTSMLWIVSLKAKKAGVLTLPSIEIGSDKTSPITINVETKPTPKTQTYDAPKRQELMLTTEVNQPKPFINQQVTYTVKLYYSNRLFDADYQEPQVDNALMVPLGEARAYQTLLNNTNYVVQEQNYAIFPQKSGPLTIKPPVLKALAYGLNARPLQTQGEPITLQVEPIPANIDSKTWLPAKEIRLNQEYENTSQTLNQGSTLIRTITLEGMGVPGQFLPKLNLESTDAYNVYTEYGTPKTTVNQGELVGSTVVKVTYLFNKPGKVTLPELKLPWFNTNTRQKVDAFLPPKTFEIKQGIVQEPLKVQSSPNVTETPTTTANPANDYPWPWLLALTFALLWIITLGLWAWQKHKKPSSQKALQTLKTACITNNPNQARDALLKWANLHWPNATVLNLFDVIKLAQGDLLKQQTQSLSEALYQKEKGITWQGDELFKGVLQEKKESFKKDHKENVLPPIHPL